MAATILRMLYIKDLRGLQTTIDETIVNVQVSSVKQLEVPGCAVACVIVLEAIEQQLTDACVVAELHS